MFEPTVRDPSTNKSEHCDVSRWLTPGITASLGWCIWEAGGATLLSIGHEDGGTGLHRIAADGSGSERLW